MTENAFSMLSDDVVLKIFFNLEEDPRNWARLACVCTKFSSMMHNVCWKTKCSQTIPSLVSDLLSSSSSSTAPPGGWAALHKLAVCCPGLLHSGVLLENSDFGLERELGPDENYQDSKLFHLSQTQTMDLINNKQSEITDEMPKEGGGVEPASDFPVCKRRKVCRSLNSHLASGVWNLSREQGNKLLASRFRGDCLYICDWPGCVHIEEKRNYMLFRGIFRNFKRSRVWRTITDGDRNKIDLNCAFCSCKQTWDLHSAFCLRRVFGFHDDGDPVVRAYVCENGHVSGAWTDWPLYT